ncbi:hypothetical protein FACS1894188_06390 [Clostridia bacterium]|nr:hypothetical protein FACS1894188_06390 [Clostridia bacterium]
MSVRKLLENIKLDELIDFIEDYAEHDSYLANALRVRFSVSDFDTELSKFAKRINIAIDNSDAYDHRHGYGYINIDTASLDNEIHTRISQGRFHLAFAEIEMLYCSLLDLYECQEECEVADEAEGYLEEMAEVAAMVSDKSDKEYIFNRCLALADLDTGRDYGAEYEYELLNIASQFVTPQNREDIELMLEKYSDGWVADELKVIQLNIIERLAGYEAADKFINDNLKNIEIRKIAYDKAMAQKDFKKAEQLCLDAPDDKNPYQIPEWLYNLYLVHEEMGDVAKLAQTAERIVLKGDLEYYDKLKSHLQQLETWDSEYSTLLVSPCMKCK